MRQALWWGEQLNSYVGRNVDDDDDDDDDDNIKNSLN